MNIDELRKTPIPVLSAEARQSYLQNRSLVWESVIPNLPIEFTDPRSHEPLIDCESSGLCTRNYYTQTKLILSGSRCDSARSELNLRLRKTIVEDLVAIDSQVRECGLRLLLMSGYRHPRFQEEIIQAAIRERGRKFAKSMFADPSVYSPHATGGAFDLELWDVVLGRVLPTKVPGCINYYELEERSALSSLEEEARDNRRLLFHLLSCSVDASDGRQGFVAHPFEYWHFGRHERLSSYWTSLLGMSHPAYYDEIHW